MMQVSYAIIWWLILLFIGLITFPLVSRICRKLPDKGYSISKILGLLLLTYFSWLLASLHIIKFGYINISISVLILIILSFYFGRENLRSFTPNLRSIVFSEAVFTAAFLFLLVYLGYKPDIFNAFTEDFMDFAFLQSILRSDYFPPADPWLAGENLPYYYGGQLTTAILTLISRIPSSVSYNLAMAMFFGLLASASYGIGYNVTKRKLYGFVTVLFVCFLGYISGIFQLSAFVFNHDVLDYSAPGAQSFVDWLLTFDVGTGVIPHTENLYPYAAFLKGELHANTTTLPFQLMYVTLIFSSIKKDDGDVEFTKSDPLLRILILGIGLGFFLIVNTWDYPVYLVLTVLAFILFKTSFNKKAAFAVILLSLIMYIPYLVTRSWSGTHGIGIVTVRTELADFLEMFFLSLFVIFASFYTSFIWKRITIKSLVPVTLCTIAVALAIFILDFQLLLILIPLMWASTYYLWKSREKSGGGFIQLLVLMGALLVLFCEIFYIRDSFSPPDERYNTVFKLYLPVWILLSIAAAYGIFRVSANTKGKFKAVWVFLLLVFIAASMIQPVGQTIGWASGTRDYFGIGRGTLDGTAYVKNKAPGDYEAIQWINSNIKGQPVLLEAPGGAYDFSSHVATMTGLPTVIGWLTHEVMWRGSWDMVSGRDTETNTIYNAPGSDESLALLRKYNVEYIFIGKVEKERYPSDSLAEFASHMERYTLIYQNQDAEIYQINP